VTRLCGSLREYRAERPVTLSMVLLLFPLILTCFGSRISVREDNGSLNIMTVNGTVMIDQLDLKEAIASLDNVHSL
jgi:hypothetical protein